MARRGGTEILLGGGGRRGADIDELCRIPARRRIDVAALLPSSGAEISGSPGGDHDDPRIAD